AMVLIGFNIIREFTPFMRFDGYYLLADVLGVHEPLTLLGPAVRDLLPGRSHRRPSGLTRRTRLWLSVYLIVVLAFLLRPLILMAALGWSSIISAIGNSGRLLWNQLEWAWHHHDVIAVVTGVLQLAFWSLVPIGL